ncbi:MAG: hypothetical protein HKN43_09010 [Rhodothermales bacterium]|nr:hypothetical protein [Rhodothermales bacterium]
MPHKINSILFGGFLFLLLVVAACDSDITGERFDNLSPDTQLSVRDTSLVDNLVTGDRLSSTVLVSWSGDDPDGFIASFDIRFYSTDDSPAPEDLWTNTVRNDSLVLLPIPRGNREADVVFEVRAIDNEGNIDPTPAKTVFPIQNAPPEIRFSNFDLPPDTTFGVFSFAWIADDPEGIENIDRIEISLNDSLNFIPIDPTIDFVTLVADVDKQDDLQTETSARIFAGRGFQATSLVAPGLLLDAENTFYIRAVDQTDTTSTVQSFAWHIKKSRGDILYVNDFRKSTFPGQQTFHLGILREYLPEGTAIDYWDLSTPFVTGSAGNTPRSEFLPGSPDPAIRQFLAQYEHIYWVSTNTINNITSNNLPFVGSVLDIFFDNGGSIMVHSPITLPPNPEDNLGNPALLLLPINSLISFPDSLRPQLRMSSGTLTSSSTEVPGTGQMLPVLKPNSLIFTTLPYSVSGSTNIPLMEGTYSYVTRSGSQGPWFGSTTVASMSADRRVGLFTLPLLSESSGEIIFSDENDDTEAARDAVKLLLEGLNFPQR